MRNTSTKTSTGHQLTLLALWAKGAQGAVLKSTHVCTCDMTSMAILFGLLLLLLVWWKKDQGSEQAGTRKRQLRGWWSKGLVDEHGKRERGA